MVTKLNAQPRNTEYTRESWPPRCDQNEKKGSHKELLHKLKTTTCHQIRTVGTPCNGFPRSFRMILVTLALPRSRCTTTRILPAAFVLLTLERNDVFFSLSPASARFPHRLSHAASSFFTRRPHSWSRTARIHPVFFRSTRRELERHASQFSCGFLSLLLNLGQCARGWSSAHVTKASYVEAVHELHQHLRPFACEMLRAQVRRVCF